MRQENEGEDELIGFLLPGSTTVGGYLVLAVFFVLIATVAALGKEADPYSQLGFVTPNNVTVVPKGPRGIMKDIPAIKRALEADVRRVEA